VRVRIPHELELNLITAPVFVATKLEAFMGRGNHDYLASHDLEDVLTIVDGRPQLLDEVMTSPMDLQGYIVKQIAHLLSIGEFMQALSGHLPPDAASQSRLPELRRRLEQLAHIAN
jgi:predicted nucleotidyltransferase